jgi:hypothetical protein
MANPRLIVTNVSKPIKDAYAQVFDPSKRAPDPAVRLLGDTIEIDYTYNDFGEQYRGLRQFIAVEAKIKNERESWLEKFATPFYKQEQKNSIDSTRDSFRGFAFPPSTDPGLKPDDPNETQQTATAKCLAAAPGMCLGGGHSDTNTKALLCDALDNGSLTTNGVGMLFIEEFKTWAQPMLDDYLSQPAGSPMPKPLADYLDGIDAGFWKQNVPPKSFKTLVQKAQAKGVKIYGIDSGEADPGCNNQSAIHPERRVALMNKLAEGVIRKAQTANPGKKFVAMVGAAHSNSHEGGIPGLAQIFQVPAVVLNKDNKLKFHPDNPANHSMPSKAEQEFIDAFIQKFEEQNGGPVDNALHPGYKTEMRAFARTQAASLQADGKLNSVGDVAACLKSSAVKRLLDERVQLYKDRPEKLKKIADHLKSKDHAKAVQVLQSDPALWDYELDPNSGYKAMHVAAVVGDTAQMQALAAAGGDLSQRSSKGDTPLTAACGYRRDKDSEKVQQAAMVKHLLAQPGVDKDAQNAEGRTAMHLAAWNGNELSLAELHAQGASTTKTDNRGWTPAQVAMTSTKPHAEQFFYDKAAGTNQPVLDPTGPARSTVDILCDATLCEPPADPAVVRATYEDLYSNPSLRPILDLVALDATGPRDPRNPQASGMRFVAAADDNVGKLYNARDATPPEGAYDEKANVLLFSTKGNKDLAGVLAHEMTHAATRIVHGMDVTPAPQGTPEMKAYRDAIEQDVRLMPLLNKDDPDEKVALDRISGRMGGYVAKQGANAEKSLLQEYIVGVPQLIAQYGDDFVQDVSPNLKGYFDQFAQRCTQTAQTDPRYAGVRGKVDNTQLQARLSKRVRPVQAPKWVDTASGKTVNPDALFKRIKDQCRAAMGSAKLTQGVTLVYSPDIIEIQDKKDFDKRIKLVEKALKKGFKDNPLPAQLSPRQLRQFMQNIARCAAGNPKNIEKQVAAETSRFVRLARKSFAQRQVATDQNLTEEELAELIVLESEDRVLAQQSTAVAPVNPQANPKKHSQMVKDLARTLRDPAHKAKLAGKKTSDVVQEMSKALAGDETKGFYQKPAAAQTDHVSIKPASAKQTWVTTLNGF